MSKYFLCSENFTSIHIQITTMPFGSKNARMPKEAVITRERRFKEPINATIHIYIHFQSCLGFWWHPAHIAPFLLVSGSYIEYSRIYDTTLIIFKTGSNSSPRSKQGFSIMRALDASLLAPILYTRPTLVCSAKGRMVLMRILRRVVWSCRKLVSLQICLSLSEQRVSLHTQHCCHHDLIIQLMRVNKPFEIVSVTRDLCF